MQPKHRMKKTLLASALILGLGNAFNASSDTMNVRVGTISDVSSSTPVTTNTEVSFGTELKANAAVGTKCTMAGITGLAESKIQHDQDGDGNDTAASNEGVLSGTACLIGGGKSGTPMIIEISGAAGALVSVSVPNVDDGVVRYTPTNESCIVDYSGDNPVGSKPDDCKPLGSGILTGVGLWAGSSDLDTDTTADFNYTAKQDGTTRMVLAGELEVLAALTAGNATTLNLDVVVTYE